MSESENHKFFEITIFDSKYDNRTNKKISKRNWSQFKNFFKKLSELKYTKSTAPLISPAIYKKGSTRSNTNVISWGGWAALDIDSHSFNNTKEIGEYMSNNHEEKSYICYSTPSSSIDKPRFRLVFPLSSWVHGVQTVQKFWFSLNKEFSGMVDEQTKDASRMYYVPATYLESTNNFFWIQNGNPIDPNSLIEKHGAEDFFVPSMGNGSFLDMLPEGMKEEVVKFRKRQIHNDGKYFAWTNYKDCPFVKREQLARYKEIVFTRSEGRYRGLYQLMVSIAGSAVSRGYPITSKELIDLILEIDMDIDGYYKNRKISVEVERALAFVYSTGGVL